MLVFEIIGMLDEVYLFVVIEVGFYVFIIVEECWYYLGGDCLFVQIYWLVEYLFEIYIVCFGIYGWGIWDFEFDLVVASNFIVVFIVNFVIVFNLVREQFIVNLLEGIWEL